MKKGTIWWVYHRYHATILIFFQIVSQIEYICFESKWEGHHRLCCCVIPRPDLLLPSLSLYLLNKAIVVVASVIRWCSDGWGLVPVRDDMWGWLLTSELLWEETRPVLWRGDGGTKTKSTWQKKMTRELKFKFFHRLKLLLPRIYACCDTNLLFSNRVRVELAATEILITIYIYK